jgi:hypothetical protein
VPARTERYVRAGVTQQKLKRITKVGDKRSINYF